jgi:hypothetical protein
LIVSKKQFALLVNRSPAAITEWISKGLPLTGAIGFEKGRSWAERNVAGFGGVSGPGVTVPFNGKGAYGSNPAEI